MWLHGLLARVELSAWLISTCVGTAAEPLSSAEPSKRDEQTFTAKGVVKELKPGGESVLVSHEAITNFMDSMTMPIKVKEPEQLAGLRVGDRISFLLHVTKSRELDRTDCENRNCPAGRSQATSRSHGHRRAKVTGRPPNSGFQVHQ
jgi:Cu/Ag efflux protein CusF